MSFKNTKPRLNSKGPAANAMAPPVKGLVHRLDRRIGRGSAPVMLGTPDGLPFRRVRHVATGSDWRAGGSGRPYLFTCGDPALVLSSIYYEGK